MKRNFRLIVILCIGILSLVAAVWINNYLEKEEIIYKRWYLSKDSLCNNLLTELGEVNISFYSPSRRSGQRALWIVKYNDVYNFYMKSKVLIPIDGHTKEYINKLKQNGTNKIFEDSLLHKVDQLKKIGIYSIIRTDSTLRITTTYYDSSFAELKKNNPAYSEIINYNNEKEERSSKPFVLVFFITRFVPGESYLRDFSRAHFLWELSPTVHYYRRYL